MRDERNAKQPRLSQICHRPGALMVPEHLADDRIARHCRRLPHLSAYYPKAIMRTIADSRIARSCPNEANVMPTIKLRPEGL
jgi:hypothetical protein